MFIPHTYATALGLMILSGCAWGSWANAQKEDSGWRFELIHLDCNIGMLVCAVVAGVTFGNLGPASAICFLHSLDEASTRSIA